MKSYDQDESLVFYGDEKNKTKSARWNYGAYKKIGRNQYKSVEDFKTALEGLDEGISFQKEEVDYPISPELLDRINSKYDNKDLLEPVGGMIHWKPDDKRYREQRCIEIYGKLI